MFVRSNFTQAKNLLKSHPDKDPSAEAQAKYLLISRAYTVLLDETTRAEFDDLRTNGCVFYSTGWFPNWTVSHCSS
jgi:DnaJ-class molecular chaperone